MLIRQVLMDLMWRREFSPGILVCHDLVETMEVEETAYKDYEEG